jgi:superfamily II DNA helicase RecQ
VTTTATSEYISGLIQKGSLQFYMQIHQVLRKVYGNVGGFKNEFQQAAVIFTCLNKTKNLWVILPTGCGKSAVYLVPCMLQKLYGSLQKEYVTLLVVPLKSLFNEVRHHIHNQ